MNSAPRRGGGGGGRNGARFSGAQVPEVDEVDEVQARGRSAGRERN